MVMRRISAGRLVGACGVGFHVGRRQARNPRRGVDEIDQEERDGAANDRAPSDAPATGRCDIATPATAPIRNGRWRWIGLFDIALAQAGSIRTASTPIVPATAAKRRSAVAMRFASLEREGEVKTVVDLMGLLANAISTAASSRVVVGDKSREIAIFNACRSFREIGRCDDQSSANIFQQRIGGFDKNQGSALPVPTLSDRSAAFEKRRLYEPVDRDVRVNDHRPDPGDKAAHPARREPPA